MTHPMARKRILLEKVNELVRTTRPNADMVAGAIAALTDVINDMSEDEIALIILPANEMREAGLYKK